MLDWALMQAPSFCTLKILAVFATWRASYNGILQQTSNSTVTRNIGAKTHLLFQPFVPKTFDEIHLFSYSDDLGTCKSSLFA